MQKERGLESEPRQLADESVLVLDKSLWLRQPMSAHTRVHTDTHTYSLAIPNTVEFC